VNLLKVCFLCDVGLYWIEHINIYIYDKYTLDDFFQLVISMKLYYEYIMITLQHI
jgi:hypothetical protein